MLLSILIEAKEQRCPNILQWGIQPLVVWYDQPIESETLVVLIDFICILHAFQNIRTCECNACSPLPRWLKLRDCEVWGN